MVHRKYLYMCMCVCVHMFIFQIKKWRHMEKWFPCILNNLYLPCLLLVPFTLMTGLTLMHINLQCKNVALDCFQVQIALKSNKNT